MIQSCKGFREFQAIVHQLFFAFLEGSDLNNFLIIFRYLDFAIFSVIWFSFVRITLIPYKCEGIGRSYLYYHFFTSKFRILPPF